jgi:hypothetical protein
MEESTANVTMGMVDDFSTQSFVEEVVAVAFPTPHFVSVVHDANHDQAPFFLMVMVIDPVPMHSLHG